MAKTCVRMHGTQVLGECQIMATRAFRPLLQLPYLEEVELNRRLAAEH